MWSPTRIVIPLALAAVACGADLTPVELKGGNTDGEPPPIALSPPPDRQLADRLTGIFAAIDGLDEVQVTVRAGVVRLDGETETTALKQAAATVAARVEGVVHVDNEITTRPDVRNRLAPTGRTLRGVWRATLRFLPQLGAALLVFLPFLLLAHLIGKWRHPLRRLGINRLTGRVLRYALRITVVLIGILIGLDILGLVGLVGAVVGTLGVLALIASLAARGWIENYFPGMMLGLNPPFHAGDLVQIGDVEGRVVRITARATVLMSLDGEEVQIANVEVYRTTLINFSQHRERRLRFTVTLSPAADLVAAQEVGRAALLALEGVLSDPPPFMRMRRLGRDFLDVDFMAWIDQDVIGFRIVEGRAKRAVFEALAGAGIPLPQDVLHVVPPERDGRERPDHGAAPADDADSRDQAFLDEQLGRARSAPGERDLLEEATVSLPLEPARS